MQQNTNFTPENGGIGSGFKLMLGMGALLLVATIALGIVNMNRMKKSKAVAAESQITVLRDGKELLTLTPTTVLQVEEEIFPAEEGHTYTGVPLWDVLQAAKVDVTGVEKITLTSVGGASAEATLAEVQEMGNIFIVYGMDKKPLGLASEGGTGPFMAVVRQDSTGERRVENLSVLELS